MKAAPFVPIFGCFWEIWICQAFQLASRKKRFSLFYLKCTFEMINWQTESDYVFHSEPMVWKGLQGPMSQASPVSQSNNQNACMFNVKHGWQLTVLITTMHVQSSHYSGWAEKELSRLIGPPLCWEHLYYHFLPTLSSLGYWEGIMCWTTMNFYEPPKISHWTSTVVGAPLLSLLTNPLLLSSLGYWEGIMGWTTIWISMIHPHPPEISQRIDDEDNGSFPLFLLQRKW